MMRDSKKHAGVLVITKAELDAAAKLSPSEFWEGVAKHVGEAQRRNTARLAEHLREYLEGEP